MQPRWKLGWEQIGGQPAGLDLIAARHSISELPATRRPLRIGGLINTYLRRATPNYGRLDLRFSLSGSQSLHSDSCKTFISGQLSATLLPRPPTGSAGCLSERGQASLPSLCVAGGLEGRFLRALCLVNQPARPLCSRSPLRFLCPSPSARDGSPEFSSSPV